MVCQAMVFYPHKKSVLLRHILAGYSLNSTYEFKDWQWDVYVQLGVTAKEWILLVFDMRTTPHLQRFNWVRKPETLGFELSVLIKYRGLLITLVKMNWNFWIGFQQD